MSYIKGNFKKYIFRSEKGYTVGLFKIKETTDDYETYKGKTITFTGYFDTLNENDLYIFEGMFTEHERYGEQFNVTKYEITLPTDKDNIIEFLTSNLFPGIGEKCAEKIVKVLGNNCLDVILNNPDNLYLVPKITKKQKETIEINLNKYSQSYKIIVELNKYGFSTKDSLLINNKYKIKSLDVINDNVYRLIDDIYEFTFRKIDSLRTNFKVDDKDIRRVEAGIKYVFEELSYASGNTMFSYAQIISYTKRALFIFDDFVIDTALNNLITLKEVIKEDDYYFYYKMYNAEKNIAKRIYSLSNKKNNNVINDDDIKKLEEYFDIKYNDDQKTSIKEALSSDFLVITGGPGTGKTTIIKAICKLYQDLNGFDTKKVIENLALLAPTGRAAKRISEQTLLKASTIHRFLKWNKEDNTFNINENNKSDVKFVIIDESSMIDTYLFNSLLLGLKEKTKIILIGDYDQLPSVGPGQVFKDIITSDVVNVVKLNKLYRQKETSNINLFAHNINNDIYDSSIFNVSDDLIFVPCSIDNLKTCLKEYIIKYKNMSINNFITLAPIYKNNCGIDDLNYFMQDILNTKQFNKQEIIIDGVTFREQDKVIELVNMVEENIFNGDIGKIIRIKNNNPKEIYVDFEDNIVRFTPSNFNNFTLGYTISIHKSQGSEFDVVIIPVLNNYSNMLYKKLIYTAATRAKKHLIIIGEEEALKKSIFTNRENDRKTYLKEFLNKCIN